MTGKRMEGITAMQRVRTPYLYKKNSMRQINLAFVVMKCL